MYHSFHKRTNLQGCIKQLHQYSFLIPLLSPYEIKKFDDRVVLEEKTTPYNGFFQVDRYKLKYQKHEGGWSSVVVRELFERGHTVAVLPYDPVQDKVVLIEQYRIGAYAAVLEPWLSETIAGIIDSGEGAEEVAHREALE